MKQKFLIISLFFLFSATAYSQGVGAGGFNPVTLGLMDTCQTEIRINETLIVQPDSVWGPPDGFTADNVFSDHPIGGGNSVFIDSVYYEIPADTLESQYMVVWSFSIPDSLPDITCNNSRVAIECQILFDNYTNPNTAGIFSRLLTDDFVFLFGTSTIQDSSRFIFSGDVMLSTLLSMDSLNLVLFWQSAAGFDLDGSNMTIKWTCEEEVQNVGMKVFVENCHPIPTTDINLAASIQILADTLTDLIQPCMPIGKNVMQFCEGTTDTLTFAANRYHSITVYPDTLSSVFYVGNNTSLLIPANRELHYQAPECKFLKEKILLYCNETNTIIVTIE